MLKLLTKRGKTKAGLSTYYIRMRDFGATFQKMMKRIVEIFDVDNQGGALAKVNLLLEERSNIEQFVLWEFSNKHLQISPEDIIHCCTFALAGRCEHQHNASRTCCTKCANAIKFFDCTVRTFIEQSNTALDKEEEHMAEFNSILDATSKLSSMLRQYMSHRLRAKVLFSAIDRQKEWLKSDSQSKMLIVLDHKQKVLPMKRCEGQVKYYGKAGMSLLGAMHVQWIEKDAGDEGFQYNFSDVAIKGYSAQDNLLVCALLQTIVRYIAEKYPFVNELCFQSDNATCFASQELIPFIYHLNEENDTSIRIIKWLYTEAQTGRYPVYSLFLRKCRVTFVRGRRL